MPCNLYPYRMKLEAKSFELKIPDFSEQLLKNHLTLYQGYVTNTNKLLEIINTLILENKNSTPEFAELSRRFAWEFNGMRLHELTSVFLLFLLFCLGLLNSLFLNDCRR